jgi:ATP-dependent exoDNAse (exonuclease V) beta subunit
MAVFSRVHSFARELIDEAQEYGIPVAYEGGIELFDTDQAKLLLAWLRIVEANEDRGWATVLEETGYTLPDAKRRLETEDYPDEMVQFREELRAVETMGGLAQRVFDRYGYDGAYADTLIDELVSLYDGSVYSRGEAIEFLERNLAAGTAVDIDMSPGTDAVTLQTAHGAKGLEYPIVIMANVNQGAFPHFGKPTSTRIRYDDTLGLRQTHVLAKTDAGDFVFDRWQYDVLSSVEPSKYDEERRLLYVAMSRAKRHLLFTAGKDPSNFFTELDLEPAEIEPTVEQVSPERDTTAPLSVSVPEDDLPIRTGVHDIMDDSVYEQVTEGKGKEFGQTVHDFAEAYALAENVQPKDPGADEQQAIAAYIDTLDGELFPEHTVLCPLEGAPRIVLTGIIDLLHVDTDRVDIIDYKTDRERHAHEEYRKQLSVYYHVLTTEYPDREVRGLVYYTSDDERVEIDPLPLAELRDVAADRLLEQSE